MIFDHQWFWRVRPVQFINGAFSTMLRKGESCRILARGGKRSVLVEFESDGFRVIASRYAVRKR